MHRPASLRFPLVVVLAASLGFGPCDTGPDPDGPWEPADDWASGMPDVDLPLQANLCLAVRGNGPRLTAHASSIARIVEHYGFFEAVAGGSSASVTTFLVQAVQDNPYVRDCGGEACSEVERRARAALLYKSIHGYVEVLGQTDEAAAMQTLAAIVGRFQDEGVAALLRTNPVEGLASLVRVLSDPDIRHLVDPDVFAALLESPRKLQLAKDLVEVTSKGVNFQVEDHRFFLMPGVLNMDFIARRLGRVGQFYAGDEPVHGGAMADFLDLCGEFAWGLDWAQVRRLPSGVGITTCGDVFDDLLGDYLDGLGHAVDGPWANRVDGRVGAGATQAFVTTSLLTGASAVSWKQAQDDYLGGRPWAFEPSFDDVKFGYWGPSGAVADIGLRMVDRDDERARRFASLGDTTWYEAISASITEPGLGAGIPLDSGAISIGGWGDPLPTVVLEESGCETTLLLTRPGGAGWFPTSVSELLGMDDATSDALYSLDEPASSYALALDAADAVWCSDWDTPPITDLRAMFDVGYSAPAESVDPFFLDGLLPYADLEPDLGLPGCSPSVPEVREAPVPSAITCDVQVAGDTSADAAATHAFDGYACNVGHYAAAERTFGFHAEHTGTVEWRLIDPTPTEVDHDVLVLTPEGDCTAWGPNSVSFEVEAGSAYLLVVDGFDDSAGPFEAELVCE